VNEKQIKKLRKEIKRAQVGSFSEFAETINTAPFKLRLKIAFKILRAKL
jgi:ribosomal protein S25